MKENAIKQWNANFAEYDGDKMVNTRKWNDEFPHYVGIPTMSSLAKFMAKGLDIKKKEIHYLYK